jgi:DNA-binding winged helix-turn-helix (wHTH) protein
MIQIDHDRGEVRVHGKLLSYLMPREYQVLKVLYDADGKILTREQILEMISSDKGTDVRAIDQQIARLRTRLDKFNARHIIATASKRGYKLIKS